MQKDLLAGVYTQVNKQTCYVKTRGGACTQNPIYLEGHPKRIEQDSQLVENDVASSPEKKKKRKKA